MTALGTKSRNFNPIGIFKDCDTRDKVVNLSIVEAHSCLLYTSDAADE